MAKQYDIAGVLEMAIFHNRKASKIMEQLYNLRKEAHPEYLVLQAPFYYKVGDALASYIECNMNEMNALKPLEMPEDPDDEGASEQEAEDPNEEEKVPEAGSAVPDEHEPVIEDVIDSTKVVEKPSEAVGGSSPNVLAGDNIEFEELSQDIFFNL